MNDVKKSLKANYIMNVILQVSAFVFPLISFPYISRILLPEGTGKVNMAVSFVTYFAMLAQLGIPTYGIIQCSKVRDNREELTKIFNEVFFLNVIATVISYVILAVLILIIPRLRDEKILYFIVSLNVILGTIGIEWLYQALEEYTYITIRSIITKAISIAAMFLLVKSKEDYTIYAAILVASSGIGYIVNFIKAGEYVEIKPATYANIIKHIKPTMVFFAVACATTIYTNLDNVMLGFMTTDNDVGYYSTAVKIKGIMVCIITALGAVIMPRASYSVEHGDLESLNNITKKAMRLIVMTSVPAAVYFILFAKECILFIAGDAYGGAVLPMQIIMPTIIFIGITNIIGFEILVPAGRENKVLYSTILGAIIDLILNAILIPGTGATGAAIGTLVAEIAVMIYQMIVIRDQMKTFCAGIPIIRVAISTLAALAIGIIVKNRDNTGIKFFVYSVGAFFATYAACLVFLKEELANELIGITRERLHISDNIKNKTLIIATMVVIAALMVKSTIVYDEIQGMSTLFGIVKISAVAIGAIVLIINYADNKYEKTRLVIAVITAILAIVVYKSKKSDILIFWIFIVAAIDTDYTEIVKWSAIVHIIIIAGIVVLSEMGAIPTIAMDQGGGRIRECLGFGYCTTAQNFLFYTVLMWIYWRKDNISWYELIVLAVCAIFIYRRTDTKSAFILSMVALLISSLLKIFAYLRKYKTWYGILSTAIIIVIPMTFVMITILADLNIPWVNTLDKILTSRILLGRQGYQNYGITLFGQDITFIGGGIGSVGEYNYVDSSYMQILLNYGLIFLIIVMIYLIMISISGIKKRDTYMAVIMCLLIIHTTFDPQLIWMEYDIFLMALGYIVVRTRYKDID